MKEEQFRPCRMIFFFREADYGWPAASLNAPYLSVYGIASLDHLLLREGLYAPDPEKK